MADIVQKIIPIKIEIDSAEAYRTDLNAQFLKDIRATLNINSEAGNTGNTVIQGSNVKQLTPTQSNEILCDIVPPAGNNITIGSFYAELTVELYWFIWNDLGNHSVWTYNTADGCRKVYEGSCLNFKFPPENHIPDHRVALYAVYDSDGEGGKLIKNKFLVFTDGANWQFFIDVESSIATDSFNSDIFSYFRTFYPYCDPCEFIQLGVRPPNGCPIVLPIDSDIHLQVYSTPPPASNLNEKVWYFATSFIDVWGRHSVISPYSTEALIGGGDCAANNEDVKCFNLVLDAGSAIVDKIVVYFSNDGINWFQYDTIEKWNNCDSPKPINFWERQFALTNYYEPVRDSPLNICDPNGEFSTKVYTYDFTTSPAYTFNNIFSIVINGVTYTSDFEITDINTMAEWLSSLGFDAFTVISTTQIQTSSNTNVYGDIDNVNSPTDVFPPDITETFVEAGAANTFVYQFCANKQCIPVDPAEVARYFDDLPIASVAQAIVDDRVTYTDNLIGYDNFICPIENISVEAVQDDPPCETELATITIQAIIFNPYDETNNPVYKMESSTDIAFGGFGDLDTGGIHYENEVISAYNQQIVSGIGFPAGFRGTTFKQYSQQYRIGTTDAIPMPAPVGDIGRRNLMQGAYGGTFFYQEWKFKVPKGNYIFEIYSHLSTINNCEGTSTYFFGHCQKSAYSPTGPLPGSTNAHDREIHINACNGDVDYDNYIIIADLTKPKASISASPDAKAFAGYLKEDKTNLAVELAAVSASASIQLNSSLTDHNGFFFGTDSGADYTVDLLVFDSVCNLQRATLNNLSISEKQLNVFNSVVNNTALLPTFNECAHELVSGTITDCNGNPLGGITVALTRTGKYAVTDLQGNYTILAHDNAFIFHFNGTTRKDQNEDSLYISPSGSCLLSTCSPSCETCIPTQHVDWTKSCFNCPVATDTYDFDFDLISTALSGLKTGGNCAVGIIGYDYLDRNNEVQFIKFVQVPTLQSNGIFAPYHLQWSFTGSLNLPDWVKRIRFAVRGNDYQFLLSWDTNKVEFLDSAGNITSPSLASKIKLYIDGLNEFNTQNFFNTTTSYQFVKGDRIRLIQNGNGDLFDTTGNNGLIDLPISSLENGNSLLIPFDSRLIGLTANATFEIYRIPVCTTEPVYFEQCPSIPVLNNEPTITSGTIPFADTYMFFRAIPQPDQNGNPIIFVNPNRYESPSVSDFWGLNAFTIGRGFVRNQNARQTWHLNEIQWSDSLLEDGVINGLGTWRSINKKDYSTQNFGAVVSTKAQRHLLWFLCENDFFYVNISLNLLQITTTGNVIANPDYFGASNQKIGNIFGCALEDTNTIIYKNEWVHWIDTRRSAECISDYQSVRDISALDFKGYWIEKLRYIASIRANNQFQDSFMYLVSAYDPKTDEIITTSFSRSNSPNEISYINTEEDYDIPSAETISFNYSGQFYSGAYSFVPEMMIDFDSGAKGVQLIVFKQGIPYIHHLINPATITYGNFFGIQTQPIIKFVANGGEEKNITQKRWLAVRIGCKETLFYSDEIYTEAFQFSQIPVEDSEQIEQYSECAFLCDANTVQANGLSALVDGDSLMGAWIKMRWKIDPQNIGKYFELNYFIVSAMDSY